MPEDYLNNTNTVSGSYSSSIRQPMHYEIGDIRIYPPGYSTGACSECGMCLKDVCLKIKDTDKEIHLDCHIKLVTHEALAEIINRLRLTENGKQITRKDFRASTRHMGRLE